MLSLARRRGAARAFGVLTPLPAASWRSLQLQGAREVDGVVAAQGVLGGEVAGVVGQWFVDRDSS